MVRASMTIFVSQPDVGIQPMPVSARRSSRSGAVAAALWSRRMPLDPVGAGRNAGARSVSR